jgi:hypothetical protein
VDEEGHELTVGFGPVGLAGCALLLLGILKQSRFVALLGLGAVVADVTIAELGGLRASNVMIARHRRSLR